MKYEEDIFKKGYGSECCDLISGEELYDKSDLGGKREQNINCSFCGDGKAMRIVKRIWSGDHNEYICICDNCVDKFCDIMFEK